MSQISQHMLVALDGSTMAEAALPVAFGLAKPLGASITLLHVQEKSAPRTIHGELHLQNAKDASDYLIELVKRWSALSVRISWHVHPNEQGDVARSIYEHAQEMGASLIVITTHGSGGLRDLLFGSIAEQVIRLGTTPTLVVRPPAEGVLERYACRSILIPIERQHESTEALELARRFSEATGARLTLATVVPTPSTVSGDLAASATFSPNTVAAILDLEHSETLRYLDDKAKAWRQAGRTVETSVPRGQTVPQLTAVAANTQADLVILATHGRIGLDGTFSGSTTPRLLDIFRVPVLLVKLSDRD